MRRLLAILVFLALLGTAFARNMEPGSLYYNFSLYTLDALGTSPSNCINEAASREDIESICGDYVRSAEVFIDDFETIVTSNVIDENYDIEPISDWFYLENDGGAIDFYGRTYRFGDTTFLASYQNPNTPNEATQIFFGVGSAVSAFANQADGTYGSDLSSNEAFVTASDYGDDWPLTVGSGTVRCERSLFAIFVDPQGRRYALTGASQNLSNTSRIDAIWVDNPNLPGAKISIGPLISRALDLCN